MLLCTALLLLTQGDGASPSVVLELQMQEALSIQVKVQLLIYGMDVCTVFVYGTV